MFNNISIDRKNSVSDAKVSVLIPVYNDGKYIESCLKSVLEQNVQGMEVLVLENGSIDDSWDRIKCVDDSRISTFRCPVNISAGRASLFLATQSNADYLRLFSADDVMLPGTLGKNLERARASNADILFSSMITMKENGEFNSRDFLESETIPDFSDFIHYVIYKRNPYAYPTALIKRDLFSYDRLDFRFSALFDLAIWTRNRIEGKNIVIDREPSVAYRLRKNSGNYSSFRDQSKKRERFLEKMLFFDLIVDSLSKKQITDYLEKFGSESSDPLNLDHAQFLFSRSILQNKTYFQDFDQDVHEIFFAYKALSKFDFRHQNAAGDHSLVPFSKKSELIYGEMKNFRLSMLKKYFNMLGYYQKKYGFKGVVTRLLGHVFR